MQKVILRADAGYGIGYGHFIRTLALADVLKDEFDCEFFTTNPTEYQIGEMAKVCSYVSLQEDTKFEDFLNYLEGGEIVVLDNYFFTTEYQKQIKEKGCNLVCIDDMHDKHYVADAVINHAPGALESQFSKEDYTMLYLGPDYLLLRKEFRNAIHSYTSFKENNNVYVCYGGADEENLTLKACQVVMQTKPRHIDVVVGGAYEHYKELLDYVRDKDIMVYRNISSDKIVELLRKAFVAIVPDSMVFFETCCLRRPCITGYDCDNQIFIAEYNERHRLSCEIGNLLEDYKAKLTMAYMGMNIKEGENYVKNQELIISDTTKKLSDVFRNLTNNK